METYTFKLKNRDRGAYLSDKALNISTSEDVEELPAPIRNVTPNVNRVSEGGFTVFECPAGQHSDLEWYASVLEDREGCEVVNVDRDREILSVVAN